MTKFDSNINNLFIWFSFGFKQPFGIRDLCSWHQDLKQRSKISNPLNVSKCFCSRYDEQDCKEDEYDVGDCEGGCGEGQRCEKKCESVTEEKCETSYDTEVKEECSYSTVMDRKCSLGYSVTYEEHCSPSMSCSLLGLSCRRVARCRQVGRKPFTVFIQQRIFDSVLKGAKPIKVPIQN